MFFLEDDSELHYNDYSFAFNILIKKEDEIKANMQKILALINNLNESFYGNKSTENDSSVESFRKNSFIKKFEIIKVENDEQHCFRVPNTETYFKFKILFNTESKKIQKFSSFDIKPFFVQLADFIYSQIKSPVGINYYFLPLNNYGFLGTGLILADDKGSRVLYARRYSDLYCDFYENDESYEKIVKDTPAGKTENLFYTSGDFTGGYDEELLKQDIQNLDMLLEVTLKKQCGSDFIPVSDDENTITRFDYQENLCLKKDNFILSLDGKCLYKYISGEEESVCVQDGIETIADFAFSSFNSKNLKQVNLPSSVKKVGNYAFAECETLTTVRIPAAAEIAKNAFDKKSKVNIETFN